MCITYGSTYISLGFVLNRGVEICYYFDCIQAFDKTGHGIIVLIHIMIHYET